MSLATGAGAGVGYGVGNIFADGGPEAMAFWGGIVGFGLVSLALYWMREYILYVVKAGHIAVMVHLIDGRDVPGGQGQIAYARQVVTQRFAEANMLFVMDQLVKGAIGAITGLIGGIAAFLPIPGLQGIVSLHQHGDPHVAHLCRRDHPRLQHPAEQPEPVRDGQARRGALRPERQRSWSRTPSGCRSSCGCWHSWCSWSCWRRPRRSSTGCRAQLAGWSFVLAIIFAWAVKSALIEPFCIAALMQVYFKVIAGQVPDPDWDRRLERGLEIFPRAEGQGAGVVRRRASSAGRAAGLKHSPAVQRKAC